jgi:hypothetical protein
MKNLINSLNKIEKRVLSVLLIWTCINLYFLISSMSLKNEKGLALIGEDFFSGNTYGNPSEYLFLIQSFKITSYDYSEFILYVLGAWVIFVSYKYLWK